MSFSEQINEEELTDKYDIRKKPEAIKRGILAEIATMDLLEEMAKKFEGCKKVEIEYSTPEEDVYQKIDFFLIITLENGEIIKVPIQVTSCDFSAPTNGHLDKKEKTNLDKKIEFVLGNTIHTSETVKDIEINPNYKYQKGIEEKIKKFFDENEKGIFVFIPFGKIKDKEFDSIRGEDTRKDCVYENGKPSRMLRDHFNKNLTIKKIERDLAQ